MQCPSCNKVQPMSFRCRDCGAEFVRRRSSASLPVPVAAGPVPQAAAAAVALDNPYQAPQVASRTPIQVSYGERALAARGTRITAHVVDGLIALGVYLPVILAALAGGEENSGLTGVALMISAIGILALVVYQLYLLSRDGQTLGKKAVKVRIVRYDDGSNPGFGRAVGLRLFVNGFLSMIPGYSLVDLLFIFGAERRCLHDLIAGTKVVEA